MFHSALALLGTRAKIPNFGALARIGEDYSVLSTHRWSPQEHPRGNMWLLKAIPCQHTSDPPVAQNAPSVPRLESSAAPWGELTVLHHWEWKRILCESQPPMKKLLSPLAFGSC